MVVLCDGCFDNSDRNIRGVPNVLIVYYSTYVGGEFISIPSLWHVPRYHNMLHSYKMLTSTRLDVYKSTPNIEYADMFRE